MENYDGNLLREWLISNKVKRQANDPRHIHNDYSFTPAKNLEIGGQKIEKDIQIYINQPYLQRFFFEHLKYINVEEAVFLFYFRDMKDYLNNTVNLNLHRIAGQLLMINQDIANKQLEPLKESEETFKKVFYNTLIGCDCIPDVAEFIEELDNDEKRDQIQAIYMDAHRQYQEQIWKQMLPLFPVDDIIHMIVRLTERDLPENFVERMLLSPLGDPAYLESLRQGDKSKFSSTPK